jgi:hypothetical protein
VAQIFLKDHIVAVIMMVAAILNLADAIVQKVLLKVVHLIFLTDHIVAVIMIAVKEVAVIMAVVITTEALQENVQVALVVEMAEEAVLNLVQIAV